MGVVGRQLPQQRRWIPPRLSQQGFAQGKADIGRSIFLQLNPGIALVKNMELNRIANEGTRSRTGGEAHAQAQGRVCVVAGAITPLHILFSRGQKQLRRLGAHYIHISNGHAAL
jgi:hypothetical protein